MNRRSFLVTTSAGMAAVAFAHVDGVSVRAQDAGPGPAELLFSGDELGLPELFIRQIDDGFEAPAEIVAGRYLLTVENGSSAEIAGAGFVNVPDGSTIESVQNQFDAIATYFAAVDAGTPPTGDDPAAFLYESVVVGGPATSGAGTAGQAVVDLQPGDYVIWNDDFFHPTGAISVTGEFPADLAEIPAALTITAVNTDDAFDFTVEGSAATGKQLIRFHNDSDQPHFIIVFSSPVALTDDQWFEVFLAFETGESTNPDLPPLEQLGELGATTTQSTAQTFWWSVDLQPANYGVFCFIPDPRHDFTPHSAMGMIANFSVE